MICEALTTPTAVADWLRSRVRKGEGLTAPYARRWDVGGCAPTHSLWDWRTDRLVILGSGLLSLGHAVYGVNDELLVDVPTRPVSLSADRSIRGDGPPESYMVRLDSDQPPQYVSNSPEVVIELIRKLPEPPPPLVEDNRVQVGFPGYDREPKYVGSWQWDIHGEARGEEFVKRAAAATLEAIEARSAAE